MPNALAVVIAQLEDVERQLLGQLETTRSALTALRAVSGDPWPNVEIGAAMSTPEPAPSVPVRPRGSKPPSRTAGKPGPKGKRGGVSIEALRLALRGGPLSPGALAAKFGISVSLFRYQLAPFIEQGAVVATGVTAGRRIALPAKEAP